MECQRYFLVCRLYSVIVDGNTSNDLELEGLSLIIIFASTSRRSEFSGLSASSHAT